MLFRRRDTRLKALLFGGLVALGCLSLGLGTPYWWALVQVPVAAAAGCGVGAIVLYRRRHLPPDLDLQWIDQAEAERLRVAGPPPDRALIHVRFEPEFGQRHRLDVLVDGQRVAQLPPGTACLLPLPPGGHHIGVYLDRPVTTVTEVVNAIPGVSAGYRVRNWGSRVIELHMEREASPPMNVRLVRPIAPGE